MSLETEFRDFKETAIEFISGLKEWQKQTEEYRTRQNEKFDNIFNRLNELPCKETQVKIAGLENTNGKVDKIIFWGAVSLFGVAVAWGALTETVKTYHTRIKDLEVIHPRTATKILDVK